MHVVLKKPLELHGWPCIGRFHLLPSKFENRQAHFRVKILPHVLYKNIFKNFNRIENKVVQMKFFPDGKLIKKKVISGHFGLKLNNESYIN